MIGKFRPQLVAMIILPLIVLVLVITFGGLALHQHSMRTLVGERDSRAVRAAASILSEQIYHRGATIWSLSLLVDESYGQGNQPADSLQTQSMLLDFDLGVAVLNAAGQLLAYAGDETLWEHLPGGTRLELVHADTQDAPAAYLLVDHPQTGQVVALVASPLTENSLATVGAYTPALMAQGALAKIITPSQGSVAFVVAPDMRVLYQSGELMHGSISEHPGVVEALAGKSGAADLSSASGENHIMAYSPIQPVGWALVVEEPWSTVASPLLRLTEDAPLVIVPVLLLGLAALWFVTRWIVQPMQALEAQAAELAWGNFTAIEKPVGGIAEIRQLQAELVHMAHKLNAAQEGLHGYINAMTVGQEEERRRLARELHDDTLQALIALNQRVQLAALSGNGNPYSPTMVEIQELVEQTIQNLRRMTRALRPIYLEDLGLATALEMLAQEMSQAGNVQIAFTQTGRVVRLPANTELALYRMAQECLNNMLKHAQASQAALGVEYQPAVLRLEVSDNGSGFIMPDSPAAFAPAGHYGLLGLHERAELIGASLDIQSAPGEGTRVTVSVPIHETIDMEEVK